MALLRTWRGKRLQRWNALTTCALFMSLSVTGGRAGAPAQPAPAKEYQVKAVFLYNFAQFVEWPTTAFPTAETPLVIGVLGDDPFGGYLDETVRGEKANNRALAIERYR